MVTMGSTNISLDHDDRTATVRRRNQLRYFGANFCAGVICAIFGLMAKSAIFGPIAKRAIFGLMAESAIFGPITKRAIFGLTAKSATSGPIAKRAPEIHLFAGNVLL
jgi:hypothetical protein